MAKPLLGSTQPDSRRSFQSSQPIPRTILSHLEPVHQLQGLAVVLVGFDNDIGQLVDDDIQGALLLDRPAEVQL